MGCGAALWSLNLKFSLQGEMISIIYVFYCIVFKQAALIGETEQRRKSAQVILGVNTIIPANVLCDW